ncbi:hypothetical protein MNV49_004623 [Pseudohyphozyma bogoriensis]|nr:hypothetical protein MNV49_004623 [Pseudohyphozyma bogoriensis]
MAVEAAPQPTTTPSTTPVNCILTKTAGEQDVEDILDLTIDPLERSPYFKRLKARGIHGIGRIRQITRAGQRDLPPKEPPVYMCCGSSCGLNCVTTIWWEEEKTWRDCHEDWKEIRERLKAEEEDRKREEEEERELNALSSPKVEIEVEELEKKVEKVEL